MLLNVPRVRKLGCLRTHTPVEAGHDRCPYDLVAQVFNGPGQRGDRLTRNHRATLSAESRSREFVDHSYQRGVSNLSRSPAPKAGAQMC